MGSRNLDRIGMEEWRAKCETVADMLREGWDVISWCEACHLEMATDLALIARISGPGTSLWNRHAPCRRLRCTGFVKFRARIPGLYQYRDLTAPWPADVPRRPTQGQLAAARKADGG